MPLPDSLCAMREEQVPDGEEFVDRLAEPRQQHDPIAARAIHETIGGRVVQQLDDVRARGAIDASSGAVPGETGWRDG